MACCGGIVTYTVESARWMAAGRPVVSPGKRAERRTLCEACPHRDPVKDMCRLCGCPLHATMMGDKLERATSSCPDGRWSAVTEEALL